MFTKQKEYEVKNIRTRVVHSQTKTAWNVVGVVLGVKYKIARCGYSVVDDDQNDIITVRNKCEALEHAQFISRAFNQACEYINERTDGVSCINRNCSFYNDKYEQNCQAICKNEPYVAGCIDYIPDISENRK